MSNLADIEKSAVGVVATYTDYTTPTGYFAATTTIVGIVTTYLLRGELDDRDAVIIGRGEIVGLRQNCYLGDGLKGGEWVGGAFSDLATRHAETVGGDPEPYVGWSGRRYAADAATFASLEDGPVAFEPRPEYAPTRDER